MKILLAVDGSEYGDAAVEEVATRPWPEGSEVRVVSAAEPVLQPGYDSWALPPTYFDEMRQAVRARAQGAVDRAVKAIRDTAGERFPVTGEVIDGFPKEVILSEADSWGADLVVVGSHGYGTFKRVLLGSVSDAVAGHAHCSVEIVRPHAAAAKG